MRHTKSHPKAKPLRFDQLDTGCMVCVSHARSPTGHTSYNHPNRHKVTFLHRVIYELHNGSIKDDEVVRHTCDNPPCCNPKHLVAGSQQDNLIDMVRKGRGGRQKLTCEQVEEIRERVKDEKQRDIADEYGVTESSISKIKHNAHWKHI